MKKISLLVLCAIFSMFFFVSCGSSDEEDTVDTEGDTNSNTQSDTDTDTDTAADAGSDTEADAPADTDTTEDTVTDTDADTVTDTGTDTDSDTDTATDTGDDNGDTGNSGGNQTQSGQVGAPCSGDNDCTGSYSGSYGGESYDQEAVCLTQSGDGFPGGYCSFMCDMTDHAACDQAGGVYHGYNGWGDGFCYSKCSQTSDCREGYICSEKIHACMPNCEVNECIIGNCDETEKVCL